MTADRDLAEALGRAMFEHPDNPKAIIAALATRGWRLYRFDNPVAVTGGVAATPAPPGSLALDVERLAKAMSAWWAPISEHLAGPGTYRVSLDPDQAAAAIAAAYAALTAQEPVTEGTG